MEFYGVSLYLKSSKKWKKAGIRTLSYTQFLMKSRLERFEDEEKRTPQLANPTFCKSYKAKVERPPTFHQQNTQL